MFHSVVESEFFEPEKLIRDNDGQFHIQEKNVLKEKKKLITKAIEGGEYEFHIECNEGRFTVDFCVKGETNNSIVEFKKALSKGKSCDEHFILELNEEPGKIECTIADKSYFWQRSKYMYSITCVKSFKVKKKDKKLKARLFANGKMKWVSLFSNVEFAGLSKKFIELYGPDKVLQYQDNYGEVATIDDQESLDIFFDENLGKEKPPKLFYIRPGEPVRFDTSLVSTTLTPGTPINIQPTLPFSESGNSNNNFQTTPVKSSTTTPSTPGFVTQKVNQVKALDQNKDEIFSGHWQLGGVIGKGGNATVYLGMNELGGKLMAVKEINIKGKNITKEQMDELLNEINLMKRFSHRNIVRYLGMEKKGDFLYIFVDYIPGGSLESILEEFSFTESLIQTHTRQILEGLKYLHDNDIIHRDIKCGNILLDENGRVYLADFGCSKKITNEISSQDRSLYGTPNYMAPEVICRMEYTNSADVWALGCSIIEMITRKPPWQELITEFSDPVSFLFYMQKNIENIEMKIPNNVSEGLRGFLEKCFIKDPRLRPSIDQLIEHPWVVTDVTVDRTDSPSIANNDLDFDEKKEQKKEEENEENNEEPKEENEENEGEEDNDDEFLDDFGDIPTFSEEDGEEDELLPEEKVELKKLEENEFKNHHKEEKEEEAVSMNIFDSPPKQEEDKKSHQPIHRKKRSFEEPLKKKRKNSSQHSRFATVASSSPHQFRPSQQNKKRKAAPLTKNMFLNFVKKKTMEKQKKSLQTLSAPLKLPPKEEVEKKE